MNPLVSEMISTRTGQDVELRFLEDLLNNDCECESPHAHSKCTTEVTHVSFSKCKGYPLHKICLGAAETNIRNKEWANCNKCGQRAWDCWEIRPI